MTWSAVVRSTIDLYGSLKRKLNMAKVKCGSAETTTGKLLNHITINFIYGGFIILYDVLVFQ